MCACSIRKGLPGGVPLFRAIWRIVGPEQKYEREEEVVQEDENAVESDEGRTRARGTERASIRSSGRRLRLARHFAPPVLGRSISFEARKALSYSRNKRLDIIALGHRYNTRCPRLGTSSVSLPPTFPSICSTAEPFLPSSLPSLVVFVFFFFFSSSPFSSSRKRSYGGKVIVVIMPRSPRSLSLHLSLPLSCASSSSLTPRSHRCSCPSRIPKNHTASVNPTNDPASSFFLPSVISSGNLRSLCFSPSLFLGNDFAHSAAPSSVLRYSDSVVLLARHRRASRAR